MNNNLRRLEKDLRSYAKRCKDVKYTSGLLLTFLLTGMLSLATTSVTNRSIEQQRQSINNSISNMRQTFRRAKTENNKLLKNANLELIQLMEQGDQVVKSEWSSWQFGANYYYNSWNGV
ncbi:MAG: autotransporter-associated N-terminal domain-containing protein, partial [Leptotrichiaceae bacterium]|nr:autotransporter-associated N-terminal domain-containing protein [Leptotrichiaceae bacterium]